MLDEDLREHVDGGQSAQGDGAVTGPHQVHAENTRQVRRRHLVDDALLTHLRGTHRWDSEGGHINEGGVFMDSFYL